MFSFKKWLHCIFVTGHKPDQTHGYDELPAKKSHCLKCGKELNP